MPFDGSGNFTRVRNWVSDAVAGIKIKSDLHDSEDDNFASGLSLCLTKDGQSQPTANIPMNGKKLVNLGAPTAATDAATKAYADAVRTFNTGITLSGANPQARIGFTFADIGFGAREAGSLTANSLNRFVWNSLPDLSGSDIAMMDDNGQLSLLGPNCIMNNVAQVSGLTFVAMSTGYAGWLQFNKLTGAWTLFGTAASVTGGAAAVPVTEMTIDGGGHMALGGAALGTNTRSNLTFPGDITFAGSGFLGLNVYYDTVAAAFKAATAGWSSYLVQNTTTGDIVLARSAGSVAANAVQTPANVVQFNPGLGTFFLDQAFQYGIGSGAVYHQNRAVSVGFYRMSGTGNFSWTKTANGLQSGSGSAQLMSLDDGGNLIVAQQISCAQNFASTGTNIVLGTGGVGGGVFLRPNGVASGSGQVTISTSGTLTVVQDTPSKPTAGGWVATSDIRLKNVQGEYKHGLAELLQIQPVVYTLKANPDLGPIIGLIAQDIETALPETVKQIDGEIDGKAVTDLRQYDMTPLTYALINAVKELSARIDELEAVVQP